jgi:hypothetical protein
MFTKFKNLFATKGKVLVTGVLLIFSILAAAVGTYAWFEMNNHAVDQIKLTTDDNTVVVNAYAYKQGVNKTTPNPSAYNKNNGKSLMNATAGDTDSSGAIMVNFSSDVLGAFSYDDLYSEELSMDENDFPHIYVVLEYLKPVLDGFVTANVTDITYATAPEGYTDISSALDFQYRYVTEQNTNAESAYKYGLTAAYSDSNYISSDWTTLTGTNPDFSLYNATSDIAGYVYDQSQTILPQCYVPGFNVFSDELHDYYFSKATLLEFRIDPMKWVDYFKTHRPQESSGSSYPLLSFGVNFKINLSFSSIPSFSNVKVPKIILSSGREDISTNSSATISFAAYNFSATPSVTAISSDTNVATVTISGSDLNIETLGTAGSATITVTATYTAGNESAQGFATINSYSGPTLIISPNTLSIVAGDSGTISTHTILFAGTPTITTSSSDSTLATATTNSDGVTIKVTGLLAGTATITVTATYSTSTSSKICNVTILAGSKTVNRITANTNGMKTSYKVGESLSTSGLVVTAYYNDGTHATVSGWTTNPVSGTALTAVAKTYPITVVYQGMTTSISVSVTEETTFSLVTSMSQLVIGGKFLIASGRTTKPYCLGNSYVASGARSAVAATKDISNNTLVATTAMEQLTLGGNVDEYTFYANSSTKPGYLRATAAADATDLTPIGEEASISDNGATWKISLDSSYVAQIQNNKYSTQWIKYLSGGAGGYAARYRCYGSTAGTHPYLFVKTSDNIGPSLSLSKSTISVPAGETANVTATTTNEAVVSKVETSDGYVATVKYSGNTITVVGQHQGTCTVRVTAQNDIGSTTAILYVTVTAPTKTLVSIAVTTPPTTTTFAKTTTTLEDGTTVTDPAVLDLTGMVVKATFSNSPTPIDVTDACVTMPADGSALLTDGTQNVIINYTFAGVTATTTLPITVSGNNNTEKSLFGINVTAQPTKKKYIQGQSLNTAGLVVTASYSDGSTADVTTNCNLSINDGATLSTVGIITDAVSYTYGGATATSSFQVTVISSDFYLATNINEIKNGRRMVIVSANYATAALALGDRQNTYKKTYTPAATTENPTPDTITYYTQSNRKAVPLTIKDTMPVSVTPSGEVEIFTLVQHDITTTNPTTNESTTNTYWLLKAATTTFVKDGLDADVVTNGYIYPGSSTSYTCPDPSVTSYVGNYVATSETTMTDAEAIAAQYLWSITISPTDGATNIIAPFLGSGVEGSSAAADMRNVLHFNASTSAANPDGLFACYRPASQNPLYIFVEPEA